jgi:hypothetical protein
MLPHEIDDLIAQHLPDQFMRAALSSVFLAHRNAYDLCQREFAGPEAINTIGYVRRGKLEGYLRDAADRFDEVIAMNDKADRSGWNHVELHAGPFVLTCNTVPAPAALVDKAEFRMTLAESNQLSLFDPPGDVEQQTVYGMLLHSRSNWDKHHDRQRFAHLPGSGYLVFPAPGLDYYVHEVNLFERFPDIVTANVPNEWDEEETLRFVAKSRKVNVA